MAFTIAMCLQVPPSEAQNDTRGQAKVTLGAAQDTCLQPVSLEAPRDRGKKLVIDPAANSSREAGVRMREIDAARTFADMSRAKQGLSKRCKPADRDGGAARTDRCAGWHGRSRFGERREASEWLHSQW
jgi:hypothetical protein